MVLLAVVTIVAIPLTLIFLPLRKLITGQSDAVDPAALAEFERGYDAIKGGDASALSALAAEIEGFPARKDRFLCRTWLNTAVSEGAPETVRWMLARGVEVNYFDEEGLSPLQTAVSREDDAAREVAEILIAAGAEVNAKGTLDVTALHTAAALGSEDVVRLLLEHGADAGALTSDYVPERPADWAERAGREQIARLLRASASASPGG
ncbi:ankyrin repeat domain-containing protein [Rhodophyticola sp. MJ-SS7]|nr:ankyrin repeat domain-containing protein [Rhodophyticola sp. MJ-SS7]